MDWLSKCFNTGNQSGLKTTTTSRSFLKSSLSDSLVFIRLNKTAVTRRPALDAKSKRWICDVPARRTHVLLVSCYFQCSLWSSPLTFWRKAAFSVPFPLPVITPRVSLMRPTWRCQQRVCEFTMASKNGGLTRAWNALLHLHSFRPSRKKKLVWIFVQQGTHLYIAPLTLVLPTVCVCE